MRIRRTRPEVLALWIHLVLRTPKEIHMKVDANVYSLTTRTVPATCGALRTLTGVSVSVSVP